MSASVCESCKGDFEGKGDCNSCNRVLFPVPPVCTAGWDNQSWRKYIRMHGVDKEPPTIPSGFGTWNKTGKTDANGDALYTL
jgi:hypothetical protein